jgi:hypothetical protein
MRKAIGMVDHNARLAESNGKSQQRTIFETIPDWHSLRRLTRVGRPSCAVWLTRGYWQALCMDAIML